MEVSDSNTVTDNTTNKAVNDTAISFPSTSYRTRSNNINRSISYMDNNTSIIKYILVIIITIIVILLIGGSYFYFSLYKKPTNIGEINLNQMNICLKNITKKFSNINSIPDKCLKGNDSINIDIKTKITFVMRDGELFNCLLGDKNCDREFADCKQADIDENYYDVLYHFIMGSHGNIYEGRNLNCSYDGTILSKESNSVLYIGMPRCDILSKESSSKKGQFNSVLKKFLSCLEESNILDNNYEMEFNPNCKDYLDIRYTLKQFSDKIVFKK